MARLINDLRQEFQFFSRSKVLDALLPPLVFVVFNAFKGLALAVTASILTALIISLYRLLKKQKFLYAMGGLIGVVFAAGLAYYSNNAINYFLPKLLSSGLFFTGTLLSLLLKKPITIWASHLSRGWPLEWYMRKDIHPAYIEVAWMWLGLFLLRFSIIALLIIKQNLAQLAFFNLLLGTPFTLSVLILSYVYGLWRLRKLQGPSVVEFLQAQEPPWQGQTRGF